MDLVILKITEFNSLKILTTLKKLSPAFFPAKQMETSDDTEDRWHGLAPLYPPGHSLAPKHGQVVVHPETGEEFVFPIDPLLPPDCDYQEVFEGAYLGDGWVGDADSDYVYEDEYSFDFDPHPKHEFDPQKTHKALFQCLNIASPESEDEDRLWKLFGTISILSDPLTEPSDRDIDDSMLLSADLVADLVLALGKPLAENDPTIELPIFSMAYDIASIADRCMHALKSDSYKNLLSVRNDDDHWEKDLHKWTPGPTFIGESEMACGFRRLRLTYTVATVCILVLDKLYPQNVCLNPFLGFMIQAWKNQTKVLLYGMEIDRRDQQLGYPGYPFFIREVIKGTAALRTTLAVVLDGEVHRSIHDLRHEPLINYMNPWGRKFAIGALTADLRVFVAALLALGSPLASVSNLLADVETHDRFDEDIKYMFEFEPNGQWDSNDEYQRHHVPPPEFMIFHNMKHLGSIFTEEYPLHPDCNCVLDEPSKRVRALYDGEEEENDSGDDADDDDEIDDDHVDDNLGKMVLPPANDSKPIQDFADQSLMAKLSGGPVIEPGLDGDELKFDTESRDWRDIPRDPNTKLDKQFVDLLNKSRTDPSIFYTDPKELVEKMSQLATEKVPFDESEKIVRSVAWLVQYHDEALKMTEKEKRENNDDPNKNILLVYNLLTDPKMFQDMVLYNHDTVFAMIDELLMVAGCRRAIIWFLTHLSPGQWIINYFHELLAYRRGNSNFNTASDRHHFSREGHVVLSDVEVSMLLHEFFATCLLSVSRDTYEVSSDRSDARRLMKILCMMLKSFQNLGILQVNDPEYRFEIQTLLLQWIGVGMIPEARELFFESQQFDREAYEKDEKIKSFERLRAEVTYHQAYMYHAFDHLKSGVSPRLIRMLMLMSSIYEVDEETKTEVLGILSLLVYGQKEVTPNTLRIWNQLFLMVGEVIEKKERPLNALQTFVNFHILSKPYPPKEIWTHMMNEITDVMQNVPSPESVGDTLTEIMTIYNEIK